MTEEKSEKMLEAEAKTISILENTYHCLCSDIAKWRKRGVKKYKKEILAAVAELDAFEGEKWVRLEEKLGSSLEEKAKTREEIQTETRELKRTEETDGCYNPFNIVHPEVQRRLAEKWVRLVDAQKVVGEKDEKIKRLEGCLAQALSSEFLEKLASLEHGQWSHLIKYFIEVDPSLELNPIWKLRKLKAETDYPELSERDKEQDRFFAQIVQNFIKEVLGDSGSVQPPQSGEDK